MSQLETQRLLSKFEDRAFNKTHREVSAADPVFVTSLPRAGTTVLLEAIAAAPEFVSHTYRDMPFLLCPLTWDAMSRGFRKRAEPRERAHGDGVFVGYDSVEAFEEVLWRAFWPAHFERTRIKPWSEAEEDEDGEFAAFLRQHMRKVIFVGRRRAGSTAPRRYVSKNNANIARLAWLERRFPDATILIPYRKPESHVRSLVRQHANFLHAHATDAFALRYMESIGHLEFGAALRPIDFDGWLAKAGALNPTTDDFWAEYWIAAFGAILRNGSPRVVIFSYDRLCADPAAGLSAIGARIGADLAASAGLFRAPAAQSIELNVAPGRAERMRETLAQLDARACF